MRISEDRDLVAHAKEIQLQCPYVECSARLVVPLVWPFDPVDRQRRISRAIEDHRRQCRGAPPEAQRVYRINYPRAT